MKSVDSDGDSYSACRTICGAGYAHRVGPSSNGHSPLGSFGGGPFDIVNLRNLNVHWSLSMLHKAGRGTAFNYYLTTQVFHRVEGGFMSLSLNGEFGFAGLSLGRTSGALP